MGEDKEKKSVFTLSISNYALIFLFIVATFFIGVGVYAYSSIERARLDIQESKYLAAQDELDQAVDYLVETVSQVSTHVSNWDEVFQQLKNPAYYSYWREHRMMSADVFPEYIASAEVFDSDGKALADLADSIFPHRIDITDISPKLELYENAIDLVMYFPILRSTDKLAEGYLGLRMSFIKSLIENYNFRYIDTSTLRRSTIGSRQANLDEAANLLDFELKSSPEAQVMMQILDQTVLQLATIVGILCLLFYFLLVYLLGKPLLQISQYIDRLIHSTPGELVANVTTLLPVLELEKIKTSLKKYQADLEKANQDLDEKNQELWVLAHHDTLTGVLNRRAFELEWSNSKQLLRKRRVGVCLILFDVNHFKAINDTYGHQTGDRVLVDISFCIQDALRNSEKLYRIGGDEFAVIIIGDTQEGELVLAQRCIDRVRSHDFASLGIKENVRVSCGMSHCQANELEKLNNLQWQADVAVYQAKRPGNTMPVLFDDEMADGTESVFSSWISDAVFEAVSHGQGIEMHYQPIVDTKTGIAVYYEALLRIRHKDVIIPPSHVFPIVTMQQMETELDRVIISKIYDDMINEFLPPGTGVSVNVSAESLAHKELIEWLLPLTDFTQRYYIVIEVTETSLITQIGTAARSLSMLRKLGFKVALDDFGSGYSSLSYLSSMPVDIIKFDISLIKDMTDERQGKLVHEMAGMLIDLDYDLVAEGIESRELLDKVSAAGFHLSQGYLFGTPSRDSGVLKTYRISKDSGPGS